MSKFKRLRKWLNAIQWTFLKKREGLYVAFLSTGGVGDLLVHLNFVKAFKAHCKGKLHIDLYHSKKLISSLYDPQDAYLEEWFNHNEFEVNKYKYDAVFSFLSRYPKPIRVRNQRVLKLSPDCHRLYKSYLSHYEANSDFYDLSPRLDGLAGDYAVAGGFNRINQPDVDRLLHLGPSFDIVVPVHDEKTTLEKFALASGEFITFNNSLDTGFKGSRSTKLWLPEYFEQLFDLLHQSRPELRLVYLGPKREQIQAPYVLNLSGETSFEELKVLLKHARLHIGPEGGMVHMREALNGSYKISCVFFGPTSRALFGHPDNINLEASDICINHCEWLSKTWQESCVRDRCPVCAKMRALTPALVFEAIKGQLP